MAFKRRLVVEGSVLSNVAAAKATTCTADFRHKQHCSSLDLATEVPVVRNPRPPPALLWTSRRHTGAARQQHSHSKCRRQTTALTHGEWIRLLGTNHQHKGGTPGAPGEDPTTDYMNVLGMIFSMCGLMMRLKWCAWVALYCSCISFANSRVNDDTKQMLSSFMLSISAVVMSYLQNPQPMTPPWSNI
ncbi:uncharacterized protein [Procambarus clarkii]|uniref:uncharacterized protein n=1 Tax=Procambarus clarkii TaxID=6728 RepID=UPI0037434F08